MTVNVETLDKLERKITLTLPVAQIQSEVQNRLKRLSHTVKMDGFRPGKVPANVIAQKYGYSVHYEVLNDKVGQAFADAAREAQLRVAGQPTINETDKSTEENYVFDAVFEVFPEVAFTDLGSAQVEKISADVSDEAIDKTIDILRRQRRTFAQRAQGARVADGDRVTVNFEGKIDGEPFEGGKAEDFKFMVGEGQMLAEFEEAVRGMAVGESKTFPLQFPADYHGKEVAGKQADFLVTVHNIEQGHLADVDDAFAKSLNVAEGTVAALREDIRKNLEREVRVRLRARNKAAVLDALLKQADMELPNASVKAEIERMTEGARAELKARGIKDADKAPIPEDLFKEQAERRVRLGLAISELVREHQLQATHEQIRDQIAEIASSYERPEDVARWYGSDRQRMAEVESMVIENNVTDYILGKAKVTEKKLSFDELMGAPTQPA